MPRRTSETNPETGDRFCFTRESRTAVERVRRPRPDKPRRWSGTRSTVLYSHTNLSRAPHTTAHERATIQTQC